VNVGSGVKQWVNYMNKKTLKQILALQARAESTLTEMRSGGELPDQMGDHITGEINKITIEMMADTLMSPVEEVAEWQAKKVKTYIDAFKKEGFSEEEVVFYLPLILGGG